MREGRDRRIGHVRRPAHTDARRVRRPRGAALWERQIERHDADRRGIPDRRRPVARSSARATMRRSSSGSTSTISSATSACRVRDDRATRARRAASRLERLDDVGARRLQRRRETEAHAREQRDRGREREHRPVDREAARERHRRGRPRDDDADRALGDRTPSAAPAAASMQTLDDELPRDAAARPRRARVARQSRSTGPSRARAAASPRSRRR